MHCDQRRNTPHAKNHGHVFSPCSRRVYAEARVSGCRYAHKASTVPTDYYADCLEVCSYEPGPREPGSRRLSSNHKDSRMEMIALWAAERTELAIFRTYCTDQKTSPFHQMAILATVLPLPAQIYQPEAFWRRGQCHSEAPPAAPKVRHEDAVSG